MTRETGEVEAKRTPCVVTTCRLPQGHFGDCAHSGVTEGSFIRETGEVELHMCGPSTVKCQCQCPDGPCEHVWDGEWWESYDGLESSTTCSRCGMIAMHHSLWAGP